MFLLLVVTESSPNVTDVSLEVDSTPQGMQLLVVSASSYLIIDTTSACVVGHTERRGGPHREALWEA